MLLSTHGSLPHLPPTYAFDTQEIVAFGNSASYDLGTGLYAGALVSLFGFNLSTSAQSVQVRVGGLPAPVFYSGSNQINFQIPFKTSASSPYGADLEVALPSGTVVLQPGVVRSLGIFTNDGIHPAALNQDGTVNSSFNPAPRGSIVSIFGTGAIWPSSMLDGGAATAAAGWDDAANRLVALDSSGTPLAILYAGAAPGVINGVFQMNLRTPAVSGPITVQADAGFGVTLSSNPVQIYAK
jgi:uncharacterized protein (TIGR03437 family)